VIQMDSCCNLMIRLRAPEANFKSTEYSSAFGSCIAPQVVNVSVDTEIEYRKLDL
jgi:hypothetical protein